jgi:hypothetical protein
MFINLLFQAAGNRHAGAVTLWTMALWTVTLPFILQRRKSDAKVDHFLMKFSQKFSLSRVDV